MRYFLVLLITLFAAACGTTDSTLQQQGHDQSYITGFHDGRHSGMREAGNNYEHYIQDRERFESDTQYREGWLAGEAEGKKLQAQATQVGEAAAGAYTGYRVGEEVDKARPHPNKIGKKAMKGVDTDELKVLEE